jgi:cytochrome c553
MNKITLGWVAACIFLVSTPLFAQGEPAAAEGAPTAIEGEPAAAESAPTATEGEPAAAAPAASEPVAAGDPSAGDAEAGKVKSAVCAGCHGLEGEGKDAPVGAPSFPSLAGQVKGYFIKSVNDYKNDTRNDAMMGAIAKGLSDVDIANLAAYYANLK